MFSAQQLVFISQAIDTHLKANGAAVAYGSAEILSICQQGVEKAQQEAERAQRKAQASQQADEGPAVDVVAIDKAVDSRRRRAR